MIRVVLEFIVAILIGKQLLKNNFRMPLIAMTDGIAMNLLRWEIWLGVVMTLEDLKKGRLNYETNV